VSELLLLTGLEAHVSSAFHRYYLALEGHHHQKQTLKIKKQGIRHRYDHNLVAMNKIQSHVIAYTEQICSFPSQSYTKNKLEFKIHHRFQIQ